MRCPSCKHRFPLPTGGHGFSDAPGVFLAASGAGFVVFLIGAALHEWSETAGYIVGGFGLLFGAGALFLIPAAMSDAQAYGPCACPKCGAIQAVYPWSL